MISVVLVTYQRGHYLDRSLHAYAQQNVDSEIVIVDDGSTDDTAAIVDSWAKDLNIVYIKAYKKPGLWRDCSMLINTGIRAARGEIVIGTHPEVIPGRKSLQAMIEHARERVYLACKIYYLSPTDQELIDTVDWRGEGALAVRKLPNFYGQLSPEIRLDDAYSHTSTDTLKAWNSWVFGGFTKATWRWFGGMTEFEQWGSVDVDFLNRRSLLRIPTDTMLDPETFCIHQNHDVVKTATDVLTPRDLALTMAVLPHYPSPESARKNFI